jgi:hypothetical protein
MRDDFGDGENSPVSSSGRQISFAAADDLFHRAESTEPNIVESVWWNFYIPEKNLDAEIYLNFRHNLGIAYAGIYIWDEFCKHFTDLRYFDTRSYLPIPQADLDDITLGNGLSMKVLEPLRSYEIAYSGFNRTTLALRFDALAEPMGFEGPITETDRGRYVRGHFDQVGHMSGTLQLDGERMQIDCITQRDRSWNSVRREDPGHPPDVGWHSAHFGDELWVQCWIWHAEPVATDLQGGIVYKRGRPVRIVCAERRSERDAQGIEPRIVYLKVKDAEGEVFEITGQVRNMFPWPGWFNMVGFAGLVEWTWGSRTGWGEVHDGRTVAGTIARKRAEGRQTGASDAVLAPRKL